MAIEGEIVVRIEWTGRKVRSVTVRSTRPHAAARVLVGRPTDDAVRIVPRLFSVCAHAQSAAAAGAIEAATGAVPPRSAAAAREAAVRLEAIQEYLWRILIDWPQTMGRTADVEPVAIARRLIAPFLSRLATSSMRGIDDTAAALDRELGPELAGIATRHVFGIAPAAWLSLGGSEGLAAWMRRTSTLPAILLRALLAEQPALGRSETALMPGPGHDALRRSIVPAMRSVAGFERVPAWDGIAVETGALARMHAHPVVAGALARFGHVVGTRMIARLAELAELVGRIGAAPAEDRAAPWVDVLPLDASEGLGVVQTARGLLLHRSLVAGGHVTGYQIVAPTEWNFHPDGALVRGLEGISADREAELVRDAKLVVQALDPCVVCRVEVVRA